MTCLKFTLPAAVTVTTIFARPPPMTAQILLERDQEVTKMLIILNRDQFGAGVETSSVHAVSRPEAAEIEYASWLPDPGAVEFASWAVHLRTSVP